MRCNVGLLGRLTVVEQKGLLRKERKAQPILWRALDVAQVLGGQDDLWMVRIHRVSDLKGDAAFGVL